MGILKKYAIITNYGINYKPYRPYAPPEQKQRKYVAPRAIPITLADADVRSCDFIVAHDLRDYRRVSFNLVLLPRVNLDYDVIAKEVYGLNEYL